MMTRGCLWLFGCRGGGVVRHKRRLQAKRGGRTSDRPIVRFHGKGIVRQFESSSGGNSDQYPRLTTQICYVPGASRSAEIAGPRRFCAASPSLILFGEALLAAALKAASDPRRLSRGARSGFTVLAPHVGRSDVSHSTHRAKYLV
jgi:hypothetical protein